jgi:hypothetical protein
MSARLSWKNVRELHHDDVVSHHKTHNNNNMTIATTTPTDSRDEIPVIVDDVELLQYGIVRATLPLQHLDCDMWAEELTKIPPTAMMFEGDHELPLYRNILETAPDFPVNTILKRDEEKHDTHFLSIRRALHQYFPLDPSQDLPKQLQLDDAFCVHYDENQMDTTGAKHQDPSDITVNMCLQKSKDCQGSFVLFHGRRHLQHVTTSESPPPQHEKILVEQIPGTATIHFGDHPHETTALEKGTRTNVILTYWYTDRETGVATRTCYC